MNILAISRKIGLIFLGIMAALLLIEFSLRIAGFIFISYREGGPQVWKKEPHAYRILCLGDSFTQGLGAAKGRDYPRQLEQMLNQTKLKKKVLIINKGKGGQNSSEVLASLNSDLDAYQPDLVILLIGMNDIHNTHLHYRALKQRSWIAASSSWISSLRVFKLWEYLRLSIKKGSVKRESVKDTQTLDSARALFKNGRYEIADRLLSDSVTKDNIWTFINLAKEFNSNDAIEGMIKTVLKSYPGQEWLRFTLGQTYLREGRAQEAEEIYKYILKKKPNSYYIRYELAAIYIPQGRFAEAESLLKESEKKFGESSRGDELMLFCYENQNRETEAARLREKIKQLKKITNINLLAIQKAVIEKNKKLIMMNYPQGDYVSRDFLSQGIGDGVLFVDNQKIFSRMPDDERRRLFSADGIHCNAEGYHVVARNVLKCILDNGWLDQGHQ